MVTMHAEQHRTNRPLALVLRPAVLAAAAVMVTTDATAREMSRRTSPAVADSRRARAIEAAGPASVGGRADETLQAAPGCET